MEIEEIRNAHKRSLKDPLIIPIPIKITDRIKPFSCRKLCALLLNSTHAFS